VSPQNLPWWGWILLAVALWFLQLILSASSDKTISTNEHTDFFWFLRAALVVGMFLSVLIGILRFVKWVWYA
jgi:hypothetical protein